MSFLSNLAGSIFGNALGNAVNSAFDLNSYEKKAEIDYNYTKKLWDYQMQNKHQLEVGDLEAAGLNKILSATNGQAVSATPISGSSSNNQTNLGTTAIELAIQDKEADIANKRADIELKNSQTEAQDAATREFESRTNRMRAIYQNKVDKANIGYIAAETGKSFAETQKVYSDIQYAYSQLQAYIAKVKSGIALDRAQIGHFVALTSKVAKEAESIGVDISLKNADLNSWTRKLENKTAEYQYEFLTDGAGEIAYKFGYGLNVINPFDYGGFSIGSGVKRAGIRTRSANMDK